MKTFRSALFTFFVISAFAFFPSLVEATALSDLTAATATNAIDNGSNSQVWRWNSLTAQTGLGLSYTGTSAIGGNLLNASFNGVNGGSNVFTVAGSFNNFNTGTGSQNLALQATAGNGTGFNYAIRGTTQGTNAGDAGVLGVAIGTSGATYGVYGDNLSPAGYAGYFESKAAGGYSAAFVGGNVGIGTATPVNLLDIGTSGGIHIGSGVPVGTSMALYNNSGTLTWNGVALATGSSISGTINYIPVFTGASSLGNSVVYQSGSNVGIGTTAPQSLVQAYGGEVQVGSSAASCATANNGAIRYSGGTLYYCAGTTWTTIGTGSGTVTSSSAGQVAYFQGTGTTVVGTSSLIVANGSVGIGTAAPQSLVHAYSGEVQVGSSGASCAAANNGAIRYSGGTLYYCTGTNWVGVASSLSSDGGYVNKFRNGTFDIWQRGTSSLATSSSGAYTADGWIVVASGANDTCAQDSGTGGTTYSLKCTGATSNTDTKIEQRVESYVAAPLAGNTVTVQFYFKQNTGASVTPKVSTCYASAQDNFTTCTSDLAATSLTSCATGTWCLEAYALNASASASNGYQVTVDCNTALSSAQSCWLAAADIRATNGVAAGINASPPPPELRPVNVELGFSQRYFQSSYNPWVTAGTSDNNGPTVCLLYSPGYSAAQGFRFPVTMRASPTMSGYAPDGTSGDWIDANSGLDKAIIFGNPSAAGIRYVQLSGGGTTAAAAYCGHYTANSEL